MTDARYRRRLARYRRFRDANHDRKPVRYYRRARSLDAAADGRRAGEKLDVSRSAVALAWLAPVEIEVARRLGDRLAVRLLQRLFEAARQRVAARLLGLDRLLEDRLAPRRLFGEDPLRVVQLGLVAALGLVVRDDPAEVEVDRRASRGSTGR